MEQQLVVFKLAGEDFGVDIAAVESIIKMQTITKVPHSPAYVEGITNLRGMILPVIDLRSRFGMEPTSPDVGSKNERRIVVVAVGKVKVGMVVDAVSEVLRVSSEVVEAPPAMVANVNSAFITGIAKVDDRLIIRLELNQVLAREEVGELEAAY